MKEKESLLKQLLNPKSIFGKTERSVAPTKIRLLYFNPHHQRMRAKSAFFDI